MGANPTVVNDFPLRIKALEDCLAPQDPRRAIRDLWIENHEVELMWAVTTQSQQITDQAIAVYDLRRSQISEILGGKSRSLINQILNGNISLANHIRMKDFFVDGIALGPACDRLAHATIATIKELRELALPDFPPTFFAHLKVVPPIGLDREVYEALRWQTASQHAAAWFRAIRLRDPRDRENAFDTLFTAGQQELRRLQVNFKLLDPDAYAAALYQWWPEFELFRTYLFRGLFR